MVGFSGDVGGMPESVRRVRRGFGPGRSPSQFAGPKRVDSGRTGVNQGDRVDVPNELWQLGRVAVSQGQNLLVPLDYHGLPPAIIGRLVSQDHVADGDLLPTAR